MGGFCASMVRTCTGEVCVRSTCREPSACGRHIERVVHLPRGMIRRDVQLGEIVVVVFDVRPFGDGETQIGENRGDLVQHLDHGMDGALRFRPRRQRDVDPFGRQPRVQRRFSQLRFARGDRFADAVAQAVDQRALAPCAPPATCRRASSAVR